MDERSRLRPLRPGRLLVLVDADTTSAVTWNGSRTFNVWEAMSDGDSTRLLSEVAVFSVVDPLSGLDEACEVAADWWLDATPGGEA